LLMIQGCWDVTQQLLVV